MAVKRRYRKGEHRVDRALSDTRPQENLGGAPGVANRLSPFNPAPGDVIRELYTVKHISSARMLEGWKPPQELNRSLPRRVRLTAAGTRLCAVSALLFVGG